ncbi:MAG: glutaredoxin family protein [Blastocatellia bacterium]
MAEIKMYTTTWCPDCKHAKAWLEQRGLSYEEINVETTPGAADLVLSINSGKRKVPTFIVGEDRFHNSPFNHNLMQEKFGGVKN